MNLLLLSDRTWLWAGGALYLAGFVLGSVLLAGRRRHSVTPVQLFIAAGFIVQTIGLYARGQAAGGCPIGNKFELVQFIAWSAIFLYLIIGPAFRMSLLGFFSSGLAACLSLASLLVPAWDAHRRSDLFGNNPWVEFHAALALFSYAVFGVLAMTSLMYLLQNYSLKQKRLRGFFSFLPPILDLEHMNLRLLLVGVAILSTALALGSVHWVQNPATVDPLKLFATVAVWIAYLSVLLLRAGNRLVSSRMAWACVLLFALALLSIDPINASRPGPEPAVALHGR